MVPPHDPHRTQIRKAGSPEEHILLPTEHFSDDLVKMTPEDGEGVDGVFPGGHSMVGTICLRDGFPTGSWDQVALIHECCSLHCRLLDSISSLCFSRC